MFHVKKVLLQNTYNGLNNSHTYITAFVNTKDIETVTISSIPGDIVSIVTRVENFDEE